MANTKQQWKKLFNKTVHGKTTNLHKATSDHYQTYQKIHKLNLFYGTVVGLRNDSTWKYNNVSHWTKFMLIFGTAIAIYSHLTGKSENVNV